MTGREAESTRAVAQLDGRWYRGWWRLVGWRRHEALGGGLGRRATFAHPPDHELRVIGDEPGLSRAVGNLLGQGSALQVRGRSTAAADRVSVGLHARVE